ncbi:unnamed protein product [Psylliodes chrysocephalus]|uniref:Uncharacterized protein n=1 Tax=Psylliodes chrysocephalus TaxID=3402493 RepID=A0A9P0GCK8_9CUCU|nr:unnamed protein product [Psylliodes chrysocephala]
MSGKSHQFCRRKQGQIVPALLNAVTYAFFCMRFVFQSFSILKTVNNVTYPTFQEACITIKLLEDDDHWDRTLEEASISDSPYEIRELFTIMLVFCQVEDPIKMWEKY